MGRKGGVLRAVDYRADSARLSSNFASGADYRAIALYYVEGLMQFAKSEQALCQLSAWERNYYRALCQICVIRS